MTDQELITRLQEAGETRPGDRRAAYALGLMHLERQDGESATKALKEAGSEVREAASALGWARSRADRWSGCARTFEGHAETVASVCRMSAPYNSQPSLSRHL
mgnify:CR=1 FL=1